MSNFPEELQTAGSLYDGHVTNGSLNEQIKVVQAYIAELLTMLGMEKEVIDAAVERVRRGE